MADKIQQFLKQFDIELSKVPLAVELERRTQFPKTYSVGGFLGFTAVLIFFNIWGSLLTNLIGFLYPAYASFKAIESTSKTDDTQWLTYWTVFGFLNVLEFFSDALMYWIPFYFTFKAALLLYLILPQFRGAEFLYGKFLRPYLLSNEKVVDGSFGKLKTKAAEVAGEASAPKQD
ncbi:TB2/DP1, HVA22 family-domain-containing protein [Gaertneriomyces semiglobifer]|nr:TB2/DP1, HVA22 family-domain-containing protein [Gaertneriomyces semiglobifer]